MQAVSAYGMRLVRQIEEKYPLSPRVREAFLTVPRHVFLTPGVDGVHEQWLNEVYQDTAILTKQDARSKPLSSSSQPSIMALMLESLEVQPEMRVLEIGTGTGYNAALLAHLAGSPAKITTIDIDPELAALARSRIENVVGPGMRLFTGDGRLGVPECSSYDRIIATASAFPVPPAWMSQLAPHGRLVLDLRGTIGGGLMGVTKSADGSAKGHFLAMKETISFMGLRAAAQEEAQATTFEVPSLSDQQLYAPETVEYACASHFGSYEQFRGEDDPFNIWVQCLFPSLSIQWIRREKRTFARLMESVSRTVLIVEQRADQMGVAVKGTCPLWREIVQAYKKWCSFGKPGRASMTLLVTPDGQEMRIELKGKSVTLPI